MKKKGLGLDQIIDPAAAPQDTGIPQRGAARLPDEPERRSDQMSIRMRPGIRKEIIALADAERVSIAEIIERAVMAYRKRGR